MLSSNTKTVLLAALVSGIVSPIVAVLATHFMNRNFPSAQLVHTIQAPVAFHIPTVRKNIHPLVYTLGPGGLGSAQYKQLFGVKVRPVWLYDISFANLTTADIGPIDFVISGPADEYFVFCTHQLHLPDGRHNPAGQPFITPSYAPVSRYALRCRSFPLPRPTSVASHLSVMISPSISPSPSTSVAQKARSAASLLINGRPLVGSLIERRLTTRWSRRAG
jgi:hypothetical protein